MNKVIAKESYLTKPEISWEISLQNIQFSIFKQELPHVKMAAERNFFSL
ncbi:Uncharacterised protein [Chryseobacterium taihuense]|jgi:hypothetical protein|uniref:Uncharacterized protein n=1 Tax=Chryseobacterium taihuense TaxID=1141221 RepID=A0A4U8WFG4_9FLAO|nr:Uncharacterised protein [Chryseobacterium taihuense]